MPTSDIATQTISLADDGLLREAWGRSPQELEAITGIPAERAIGRIKWLLQQRDIWTTYEQEQMLFLDMLRQKDRLDKLLERAIAEGAGNVNSKMFAAMTTVLRSIGERIDKRIERNSKDLEIVSDATKRELRDLLNRSYYPAQRETLEHFPELDLAPVFMFFESRYQQALVNEAMDRDMNVDN